MTANTDDTRIAALKELRPPCEFLAELPITPEVAEHVSSARNAIHQVLIGADDRLVTIVGPCSIHDPEAAIAYARKLQPVAQQWSKELLVVMRVYFEKPRTTVGWKGLINDPDIDGSFQINKGLRMARALLTEINAMGLPTGTEYLDLISPQYLADLVSWGAIGARTTESQTHRELASGLSCPVGFKNATNGDMQVAVDAIGAAKGSHHFLSVTKEGRSAIFETTGNDDCHIILRGGRSPNYDMFSVDDAAGLLEKAGLPARIMIDASHANSRKKPERQRDVTRDIAQQITRGDGRIMGIMLESFLEAGRQEYVQGQEAIFGQSITDPCMDWVTTEALLGELATAVRARRKSPKLLR